MKMTYSERGRLGAQALNADKEKKEAAVRKAVATIKASRPDFYSKIAKKAALKNKQEKLGDNSNAES